MTRPGGSGPSDPGEPLDEAIERVLREVRLREDLVRAVDRWWRRHLRQVREAKRRRPYGELAAELYREVDLWREEARRRDGEGGASGG